MKRLIKAIKTIRKELLLRDEPLKAYNLLNVVNFPELEEEKKRSYALVRHVYDHDFYESLYGAHGEDDVPDAELIEPRRMIRNATGKYMRYDWILSEFEKVKPESYLDLACYIGSLVTSAAARGIKATGVDMTQRTIEIASERAKSEGLDATFYRSDILEFDKVTADMVSAFEVLEHVPDPVKFIKHLKSLSKKFVYITTPNLCYGDGDGNQGHWEWDGVDSHMRGHIRAFSKGSMEKLMKDAGAEVIDLIEQKDGLLWCKFKGGAK